ncbi:unnamed protein product, partial [Porites evermanni]
EDPESKAWNLESKTRGYFLYDLYVDVSLDRDWFSSSLSFTGYIILRQAVLNKDLPGAKIFFPPSKLIQTILRFF